MAQPTFGQFTNFTAAARKSGLIDAGLFSPDQQTSWIWSEPAGGDFTPVALIGTIDGVNAIFTLPSTPTSGAAIYRNGVMQTPTASYSLVGTTVTFTASNIPQVGDDLYALIS